MSAFTQLGDSVLVQPPIYPPFLEAPAQNDRHLVEVPLILEQTQSTSRYAIDFIAFEQANI